MDGPFWAATGTTAVILAVVWQWQRVRRAARDLGAMSTHWLHSKDRHRELPPR